MLLMKASVLGLKEEKTQPSFKLPAITKTIL